MVIKLKLFEAHSLWHFHFCQLFFIVKWWWPLFTHSLLDNVTIYTVFTLTLFWAFYPTRKTWTIFFITFCFFARAILSFSFFIADISFKTFYCFCSFFWIYFVFAILAFAKGCTNSIVVKAFTIRFQALSILAVTKFTSVCHKKSIFHLNTSFTTRVF